VEAASLTYVLRRAVSDLGLVVVHPTATCIVACTVAPANIPHHTTPHHTSKLRLPRPPGSAAHVQCTRPVACAREPAVDSVIPVGVDR
jgi:hypothetical protein